MEGGRDGWMEADTAGTRRRGGSGTANGSPSMQAGESAEMAANVVEERSGLELSNQRSDSSGSVRRYGVHGV